MNVTWCDDSVFLKRNYDPTPLPCLLPPTPDAAATLFLCPTPTPTHSPGRSRAQETHGISISAFPDTQKVKPCHSFVPLCCKAIPTEPRFFGPRRFSINHRAKRPPASPPPLSSPTTTIFPRQHSTPKDLYSQPRAIHHVVLRLLAIKDNWISIFDVFYI